jgi:ectoine hydroxylase-related dioxygenase (phytanoyl-CoA dioxygenase family)
MTISAHRPWSSDVCRLDEFVDIVEVPTVLDEYPNAAGVEQGVVVYDADGVRSATEAVIRGELAHALLRGPGIVKIASAFESDVLDRVSATFRQIIADEKAAGTARGDHYAKPGANDRVWNALQKLALRDPAGFVDYYTNDIVALAARSWLGPAYQITSQVNVVNPGGEAQQPHRDYHLGFMTDDRAAEYPPHVHELSPVLTLQAAVAHCDMPVESGPTMYLPHSQKYVPGYMAWRRPEFIAYFAEHHVQLPLAAGDAVFLSPALFHAAGTNRSADVFRMANLLQISSAFGRAMEAMDRQAMVNAVYPVLVERRAAGLDDASVVNVVGACAEGYAFPTDLDRDQPVGGLSPPSQADIMSTALAEGWTPQRLRTELAEHAERRA